MFNIPDHPDIECAMRTGYPRSHFGNTRRERDEDWEFENRRDEALLAGLNPVTDEERDAERARVQALVRELDRRDKARVSN